MPQPPKYERSFDFTNWSANNPDLQQPGQNIDGELDALGATTDGIIDNLARIQRDDGALANGVVTKESLHPSLALGFGTPTPWAPSTPYTIGSAVSQNSALWVANSAHVSSSDWDADLAAGLWFLLVDLSSSNQEAIEAANRAASSAADALASKNAAASSASAAQSSATAASGSASAAAGSATTAQGHAAAANTAKSDAQTAASAAAGSAGNAATQASNAQSSATAAASSASTASTQAGAAQSSATAAAASAASAATAAQSVLPYAGFRNLLINGTFDVWQRGTSFAALTSIQRYTADRWYQSSGGNSTVAVSRQQFSPNASGFNYYARVTTVSGNTGSSFAAFCQRIENVRQFSGKRVAVSFNCRGGVADAKVGVELASNYGTGGSPQDIIPAQVITPGSDLSARQTLYFDVPTQSGKTITDDNSLVLSFFTGVGTNFASRFPGLGNQSTYFDFMDVQVEVLEPGRTATPFERRSPVIESIMCQRYYQRFGNGIDGYSSLASYIRIAIPFNIPMRVGPAYTLLMTDFTWLQGNSVLALTGGTVGYARVRPNGARFGIANLTGLTAGTPGHFYTDSADLFEFDAEL